MTGWGQNGPLAQEPGHDINYISIAGALGAIGPADREPVVPLNVIADMGGGGMLLAFGVAAALVHAKATGEGQVVDAAMTDGVALQLSLVHGFLARGRWVDRRGSNIFDGAAPFYRTYRCADGGHIAVGCVEPAFYEALLRVLDLGDDPLLAEQYDESAWPAMSARLEAVFAERSRDDWAATFDGQGACVTPVLSFAEAFAHPHNAARGTYRSNWRGGFEPGAAPRFLGTPSEPSPPAPLIGADTDEVLAVAGLDAAAVEELRARGIVA
jgi:alpha-methylacyl-CoA racemase